MKCRRARCKGTVGANDRGWLFISTSKFVLRKLKKQVRAAPFKGTTHSCNYTDLKWQAIAAQEQISPSDKALVYGWRAHTHCNVDTTLKLLDGNVIRRIGAYGGLLPLVWPARDPDHIAEVVRNFLCTEAPPILLTAGQMTPMKGLLSLNPPLVSVNVSWNETHQNFRNSTIQQHLIKLMVTENPAFKHDAFKVDISTCFPYLLLPPKEDPVEEDGAEFEDDG